MLRRRKESLQAPLSSAFSAKKSSNTLLVTRNKSLRGSTFSSSRPPSSAGYGVSPRSSARKLTPPPSSSTPRSHNAQRRSRHLGSPHESHGDIVRAAGAPVDSWTPRAFGDRSLLGGNEKSSERIPRRINRQQPPDVRERSISLEEKRITRSAAKSTGIRLL